MTVSVQAPYTVSIANGLTTVFPYTFKLLSADDLLITLNGVEQTTGFTVSGIGAGAGGNVTFSVAPASGVIVGLERDPELNRITDYQQFGKIDADILDADIDRIWLALQYLKQLSSTSIKLPFSTASEQTINKTSAERANSLLSFDAAGNISITALSAIPTAVVAGSFTVDTFSGNGVQTAFTLSRDPGVIGNTLVFIGESYVQHDDYSVSGATLTFDTAPLIGTDNIEVRQSVALTVGSPSDGTVSRDSLTESLQRKTDSIYATPLEFGAIGNGVANDTSALQTAAASGRHVELPEGHTFLFNSDLLLVTDFQRFGGPGRLRPVGACGVIVTGCVGAEVDLTIDGPAHTGTALKIINAERPRVKKLNCVDAQNMCYVEQSNAVFIDLAWGIVRGYGLKWYGDNAKRSDILNIGQFICAPGAGEYGFDWDGNCHSLYAASLQVVGGLGGIIRNTSGGTDPAIGRFFEYASDYSLGKGFTIADGVIVSDIDFVSPYILGAVSDGFYNGNSVNLDEVRISGGKIRANGGYGINNAGGGIMFGGTTDMLANTLGAFNGLVRTFSPRYDINASATRGFRAVGVNGDITLAADPNDYMTYDSAGNVWRFFVGAVQLLGLGSTYVSCGKPLITPAYTVAALPAGSLGMRAIVTDANATTFHSIVAGGGANGVPVFYDGASWRIG